MRTLRLILCGIWFLVGWNHVWADSPDKSLDPVREALFQEADSVILQAQQDEMGIFAPEHYRSAMASYNQALSAYEREGSLRQIRTHLRRAMETFRQGLKQAEITRITLETVLGIRTALEVRNPRVSEMTDFQRAEKYFGKAIVIMEKGDLKRAKIFVDKAKDLYQRMIPKKPLPIPLLVQIYNDPDETAIANGKDFQRLMFRITDHNLLVSVGFYGVRNLSEFFCYFSTDDDMAAEICVRCRSADFEVSAETQPGWYNTYLYSGTPGTSAYYYTMELPWTTIFDNIDTLKCWLYAMDGKDRLPDAGDAIVSWWSLVSTSKTETTLYQGDVDYRPTPEGWWMRTDGEVDDRDHLFFPNSNVMNADVTALLSAIGCATTLTDNDTEIWNRTVQVWNWLQAHQLTSGPNYTAAQTYYQSLGSWPSLAEIAYMYVHFGGIYWGTCMSRAQLFATLLLGVGIHPNRFAIAEAYWKPSYSQHMYVILYIGGHWYYIDPSCIHLSIAAAPTSIGCVSADYVHPLNIFTLPGSSLSYVPLVE